MGADQIKVNHRLGTFISNQEENPNALGLHLHDAFQS
jgi:hypothetical protein